MKRKTEQHSDKVKRAGRMLSLYLTLRQHPETLGKLAKKFKVNPRSIQRDLKLLKDAGANIEKETWGFYVNKKKDYSPPK